MVCPTTSTTTTTTTIILYTTTTTTTTRFSLAFALNSAYHIKRSFGNQLTAFNRVTTSPNSIAAVVISDAYLQSLLLAKLESMLYVQNYFALLLDTG